MSLPNITAAGIPLSVGLVTTSAIFFGNVGCSLVGPLPIVREQLGVSNLSTVARLRIWSLFFHNAGALIVPGSILSSVLSLSAVYLSDNRQVKKLAAGSAVASLSIIPFTFAFIMPTIKVLVAYDTQGGVEGNEAKVMGLIKKWDGLHKVRFLAFGSAWALVMSVFYIERPFRG